MKMHMICSAHNKSKHVYKKVKCTEAWNRKRQKQERSSVSSQTKERTQASERIWQNPILGHWCSDSQNIYSTYVKLHRCRSLLEKTLMLEAIRHDLAELFNTSTFCGTLNSWNVINAASPLKLFFYDYSVETVKTWGRILNTIPASHYHR